MNKKGFTTKILNTALDKQDVHGSIKIPVYDSASFEFESSQDIAEAFQGKVKAHQYTRGSNPTVEYLENIIKEVTGAPQAIATASGMGAISNTLLAICQAGDNIITSGFLFGNTYSLFKDTLSAFNIEAKFVDITDLGAIERSFDNNTRAIYCETITNPQMEVANLEEIAKLAKKNGIALIVDSTLTPACYFSGKNLGVHVEIMSSTKFISGGGTSIGGMIVDYGTMDWSANPKLAPFQEKFAEKALFAKLKKEIFRNMGGCLSPHNAYLQALGMETIALRSERCGKNALEVAQFLEQQAEVESVNYPGLDSSPYQAISKKQFGSYFGPLLSFELKDEASCFSFMDKLQLIRRATNLSDNRSLIIHPWSTIYAEYSPEQKISQGITEKLIRLSIGIEDIDDLKEDLRKAL